MKLKAVLRLHILPCSHKEGTCNIITTVSLFLPSQTYIFLVLKHCHSHLPRASDLGFDLNFLNFFIIFFSFYIIALKGWFRHVLKFSSLRIFKIFMKCYKVNMIFLNEKRKFVGMSCFGDFLFSRGDICSDKFSSCTQKNYAKIKLAFWLKWSS